MLPLLEVLLMSQQSKWIPSPKCCKIRGILCNPFIFCSGTNKPPFSRFGAAVSSIYEGLSLPWFLCGQLPAELSCYFCSGSGQLSLCLQGTRSNTSVGLSHHHHAALAHPHFLDPNPIICTIRSPDSHLEVMPLSIKNLLSGGFN